MKESRVSGYFTQGEFTGQISVKRQETFYIEPIRSRFNHTHAIYRVRDIIENSTSYSHTFGALKAPSIDHVARAKRLSREYKNCPILVAADSLFHKHVGKSSVSTTLAKMAYQISEVNKIFQSTRFFEEEETSIGLVIASLVVYEDQESEGKYSA